MANSQDKAEIGEDICPTLTTHHEQPTLFQSSSGDDVVGTLNARDFKGVGSQYVEEGKVISFAQNTRDEVRLQGDGTISGALSAQPGMKQTTYVVQTANTTRNGLGVIEDAAYTLDTNSTQAVIEEVDAWHTSSRSEQADLGGQRSASGRGSGLHAADRR